MHKIISKYQVELKKQCKLPDIGGKRCLGEDGIPSRMFYLFLACKKDLFHDYLRDCGLIRRTLSCEKCGEEMNLQASEKVEDGVMWSCDKGCRFSRSIRHGSWFGRSKLSMEEIMILIYDLLSKEPIEKIMKEYGFATSTMTDWNQFVQEVLVEYVEKRSEKIGGPKKTVKVDESKFGKGKYRIDERWAFVGVDKSCGKTFLVVLPDRSPETLTKVIEEWINPGTNIVSECWKATARLEEEGYAHLRMQHGVDFVDPGKEAHANVTENPWRYSKTRMPDFTKNSIFENDLAQYIFGKMVASSEEDMMTKFLEIVREADWDEKTTEQMEELGAMEEKMSSPDEF